MTATCPPIPLRCANGHEFAITIAESLLGELERARVVGESGHERPLTGEEVAQAIDRLNMAGRLCPHCQAASSN